MAQGTRHCIDCKVDISDRTHWRTIRCVPCQAAYQPADPCSLDGCDKPRRRRGLCGMHYQWWRRQRDDAPRCATEGCAAAAFTRGLCPPCYHQWRMSQERVHQRELVRYREYHARNKDRIAQYNRAYYAARKAENRVRCARWREANPDRHRENVARWQAANPLRVREHWIAKHARRYAQIRATRRSPIDYAAILAEHGMHCYICRQPIEDRRQLHFDHVIPLARGGRHVHENIRPTHARCNMIKGARTGATARWRKLALAPTGSGGRK